MTTRRRGRAAVRQAARPAGEQRLVVERVGERPVVDTPAASPPSGSRDTRSPTRPVSSTLVPATRPAPVRRAAGPGHRRVDDAHVDRRASCRHREEARLARAWSMRGPPSAPRIVDADGGAPARAPRRRPARCPTRPCRAARVRSGRRSRERGQAVLAERIAVADPAVDAPARAGAAWRAPPSAATTSRPGRAQPGHAASSAARDATSPSARTMTASMASMLAVAAPGPMLDSGRARRPPTIPPSSASSTPRRARASSSRSSPSTSRPTPPRRPRPPSAASSARSSSRWSSSPRRRRRRRADRVPGLRPEPGRRGAARGGHRRARHPPRHRPRGARPDGFVIGGIPPIGFDRPVRVIMDPDLGRYPDRLGRRRPADRRLRGAAGDPADPRQRDGRPDHRGAPAPRTPRRRPGGSAATPGLTRRLSRATRTPQRDVDLPGRAPRPLAVGRQRSGCRGLRAVRGRRHARRPRRRASPTIPTRCAAPSCASRGRAAPGPRASPRPSSTSRARSTGTPRACSSSPTASTRTGSRRRPASSLGAPLGDAAHRAPRVAAAAATCSSSPRSRPSRIEPDGTVAWRVAHSDVVTAAELSAGGWS